VIACSWPDQILIGLGSAILTMGAGNSPNPRWAGRLCSKAFTEKLRILMQRLTTTTDDPVPLNLEFEGDHKNCDDTRWDLFTDIKDFKKEMLKRLEAHFEKWLNP
jgi:hypothetical protein